MKKSKVLGSFVLLTLILGIFGCVSGPPVIEDIVLKPKDAAIHSNRDFPELTVESENGNFGYWHSIEDWVSWTVEIPESYEYKFMMKYAAWGKDAGSSIVFEIGDQVLPSVLAQTSPDDDGYLEFSTREMGVLFIEAGTYELSLKVTELVDYAAGNILKLTLVPNYPE